MNSDDSRRERADLRRVTAVWTLVTVVTLAMVLNDVLHLTIDRFHTVYLGYKYVAGPGLLVATGVYVERRSTRPWVVAVGTVLLVWAAWSVVVGCPTSNGVDLACYSGPGAVDVGVDVWIGGPRLLVEHDGACRFRCPYRIQLIPLGLGYGSFAVGLLAD